MAATTRHIRRLAATHEKEVICDDVERFSKALPAELRSRSMKQYVPGTYGSIAEVSAPTAALDSLSFDLQRLLAESKAAGCSGPKWAAVERSPEAGARKRRCKEVAERANGHIEGIETNTGSGFLSCADRQVVEERRRMAARPASHGHRRGEVGAFWCRCEGQYVTQRRFAPIGRSRDARRHRRRILEHVPSARGIHHEVVAKTDYDHFGAGGDTPEGRQRRVHVGRPRRLGQTRPHTPKLR